MQQTSFLSGADLLTAPHNRSATSKAAAAAIAPRAPSIRERVYGFIRASRDGCTIDEIAAGLEILTATCCGRVAELKEAKLIKDSGRTRKTRSGREAVVLVACERGEG